MNINEFSANIQYKNSFITECTITNNLLDIGEDAVLNANVKVAVSNPAVSEDQKEKIGRVRLTFDGNHGLGRTAAAFRSCRQRCIACCKFFPFHAHLNHMWAALVVLIKLLTMHAVDALIHIDFAFGMNGFDRAFLGTALAG